MTGSQHNGLPGIHFPSQATATHHDNDQFFADQLPAIDAAILATTEQLAESDAPDLIIDFVTPLQIALTGASPALHWSRAGTTISTIPIPRHSGL